MNLEHEDLSQAVEKNILTRNQADELWSFLTAHQKNIPSFRFTHVLFYLGGLIAISAVTIYVTTAWEKMVGTPLLLVSILFFLVGFSLMHYFMKIDFKIPAGIMAVFSLVMIPLMIYNLQYLLGYRPLEQFYYADFHQRIDWYWVNMELATLLVGTLMFYIYRFPFLLFPIAAILWYMSMDFFPLIFNKEIYTYEDRAVFSMFFGLLMLLITIYIDYRSRDSKIDYAFWLYIFSVMTFWGGLTSQSSDSELSKFFYFMINVALLFVSVILDRRVFAIFGTVGILLYLGHLAFKVFADSIGFTIVMVIIGISIIFIAIFFTKMEMKLKKIMQPYIPKFIQKKMNMS